MPNDCAKMLFLLFSNFLNNTKYLVPSNKSNKMMVAIKF